MRCPSCGTRFVVLVRPSGECATVLENEDVVGRMSADLLGLTWDDEDDFSLETQMTGRAVDRSNEFDEASGGPTVMSVIAPSPVGVVATARVATPRKVG